MRAADRRRLRFPKPNAGDVAEIAATAVAAAGDSSAADCDAVVARAENTAAVRAARMARRRHAVARCQPRRNPRRRRGARQAAAVDSTTADSVEAAPGPRRSAENNAQRAGDSFPLQLDRPSFARRAPVGDIFPQYGMPFGEFLCRVQWTRTFGIMDFDDDDDGGAHLCGYDRAYVCFDRFSWFAVPPTPFICNGTFAAASFRSREVHHIG